MEPQRGEKCLTDAKVQIQTQTAADYEVEGKVAPLDNTNYLSDASFPIMLTPRTVQNLKMGIKKLVM